MVILYSRVNVFRIVLEFRILRLTFLRPTSGEMRKCLPQNIDVYRIKMWKLCNFIHVLAQSMFDRRLFRNHWGYFEIKSIDMSSNGHRLKNGPRVPSITTDMELKVFEKKNLLIVCWVIER